MRAYRDQNALQSYHQIGVQAQVAEASPHALVEMLFDGALGRLAGARGAIQAGEIGRKGELIGQAISIVEGLRTSLNRDDGGDLADNLAELYVYMTRRLLEANLHNDVPPLDEVASLLRELQSGWQAISDTVNGGAGVEVLRGEA